MVEGLSPLLVNPRVRSGVEATIRVSHVARTVRLSRSSLRDRVRTWECLMSFPKSISEAQAAGTECDIPFLSRCHGVSGGAVKVVVPSDGADGNSSGRSSSHVESGGRLGGASVRGDGPLQITT